MAATRPHGGMAARLIIALVATTALILGCSGERPQLLTAGVTTTAALPGAELQVAPPEVTDCETAVGAGPWRSVIEATAVTRVRCTRIAGHQRVELVNNSPDQVTVALGRSTVDIAPSNSFLTDPVGTFLQPGYNEIEASPHPAPGLWYVEPSQNLLAGAQIGLSSIGPISLGMTPVEIAAAVGGAAVAASGSSCHMSTIDGDPYSPLFTFNDGKLVVIQVFTPGQLTRSEIGIGASEGDVLAAYGPQIESRPSPDGDSARKLLIFVPSDPADQIHRLVFVVEDDLVTGIRNGLSELAMANPDCSTG